VELQDYLTIFRKRWRLILLSCVLAVGAAAIYTLVSPKKYESSTQFFISTSGASDSGQLLQGNTFTQERVKTYSQLLTTPIVLAPVVAEVGPPGTTPEQMARTISASVPPDTVLIDVSVVDVDPLRATRIADSLSRSFPTTVNTLESVSGNSSPVKVTVVQPATTESTPVSPKPLRDLGLGLFFGLILGLGLAVLREILDTTVKSERDVKAVSDRTVIGAIPFDADADDHPLIVQADPRSPRAEAFRSLRTNLRFVDAANHPRSVVVTSSTQGEGKSTTVANLALALAEVGSRVCLVDADLRRPRLLHYMGLEGSIGLTDVLIYRADLSEVLQPFGRTTLTVMGAGQIPPNPSELLGSQTMIETLRDLEARFDHVLIDAPPLLPVTDATILSTLVGGAIVVVGAGIATREQLRKALESIDAVRGRTLGIVINRLPRAEAIAYGEYRYQYTQASPRARRKRRRESAQL
jgi:polysaccharide biosynthesis transport protein